VPAAAAAVGAEDSGAAEEGDSHCVAQAPYDVHPNAHAQADKDWVAAVLSEIEVEDATEELVRRRFQDLSVLLLLQARGTVALQVLPRLSEAAKKALQANMYRCELLRAAVEHREGRDLVSSVHIAPYWGPGGAACSSHMRRLATHASLHYTEAEAIFRALDRALRTEQALRVLVGYFPPEQGVQLVAVGMLSSSPVVRAHALSIMQRLRATPSTRVTCTFLSKLLRSQYTRLCEKERCGTLLAEQAAWGQVSQLATSDATKETRTPSDTNMAFDMM